MQLSHVAQLSREGCQSVWTSGVVRSRVCRRRPCVGEPLIVRQRVVARRLVVSGWLCPNIRRGQRVRAARRVAGLMARGRERRRFPGDARPRRRLGGGFKQVGERIEEGPHVSGFGIQCRQRRPQPLHILVKGVVGMRQGQTQ